jgi:hypothetical protein
LHNRYVLEPCGYIRLQPAFVKGSDLLFWACAVGAPVYGQGMRISDALAHGHISHCIRLVRGSKGIASLVRRRTP